MKILRFLPFLILICNCVIAQTTITGKITGEDNHLPLPYASITIENSGRGTVSNVDGNFRINTEPVDKKILVSYMGYKSQLIDIENFKNGSTIVLQNLEIQLHEVVVNADNSYLYDIIKQVRMTMNVRNKQQSRAYLKVQTNNANNPVELIECYYNVTSTEGGIQDMYLKNGRSGRVWNDSTIGFISLNNSRLFKYPHLLYKFDYLPDMPFQLGKKELRKKFELNHLSSIGDSLINISFNSVENKRDLFEGNVWINLNRNSIDQLTLTCDSAAIFPFVPISEYDEMSKYVINYTFNFKWSKGVNYIKSITTNCSFEYINKGHPKFNQPDLINNYNLKGVLYLFEFDNLFILPTYTSNEKESDLVQISLVSLNGDFWDFNHGLVLTDSEKDDLKYFSEFGSTFNFKSQDNNRTRSDSNVFYTVNYVIWRKGIRINLVDQMKDNIDPSLRAMAGSSSMYDLVVNLFLDINEIGDSIQYFTATVFDAQNTYYLYDKEPIITNIFLNLYFDICEIERQNFVEEIKKGKLSVSRIKRLHQMAVEQMNAQTTMYLKEVDRGRNRASMKIWNDYVYDKLGINNLSMFEEN